MSALPIRSRQETAIQPFHETANGATHAPQRTLRALVVVSRLTFVPGNYDRLVCSLADCPQVAGLLVLDNRSFKLVMQDISLVLLGAWRLGLTLIGNYFGGSARRRREAYGRAGKPIWQLPTINCPEAMELVAREGIDVLVNSRTRFIYRPDILAAPGLGCINIHHGLLPDQRGTLCDLWALSERQPAGFTIHAMSSKVDAGGILRCVRVSEGNERDYRRYLRQATAREAEELPAILAEIERYGALDTQPNVPTEAVVMRHDPTAATIRAMIKAGMKL